MNKKISLLLKISTVLGLVAFLFVRSRWAKWNPPNPYKLNYVKIKDLANAIDNGVSKKGEKTFLITFGSRSCPACTQLYQTMVKYREQSTGNVKDGFVSFYTTDVDLEYEKSLEFAYEHILDNKYRRWDGQEGIIESTNQIATPTTWYIKDGKVQDIIVGTTLDAQTIIDYVKNK